MPSKLLTKSKIMATKKNKKATAKKSTSKAKTYTKQEVDAAVKKAVAKAETAAKKSIEKVQNAAQKDVDKIKKTLEKEANEKVEAIKEDLEAQYKEYLDEKLEGAPADRNAYHQELVMKHDTYMQVFRDAIRPITKAGLEDLVAKDHLADSIEIHYSAKDTKCYLTLDQWGQKIRIPMETNQFFTLGQ